MQVFCNYKRKGEKIIMQYISNGIIIIIMICMLVGCIGAVRDSSHGIGFEFCEGIRQLGVIFIPVAGVMALIPYLQMFIQSSFTAIANLMGHDVAVWVGMLLPPDMGGNILAHSIASTTETWIIALFISFILGVNITFAIPVSSAMVSKQDKKYMALGILSGLAACPFGITVSCMMCMYTEPLIRAGVSTTLEASESLSLILPTILINLLPVYILCTAIAVGIWRIPNRMIQGFCIFGKVLNGVLYLAFALAVVEYFTGFGSLLWKDNWMLNPIIADVVDPNRALEISGYCAMMLGGAYPMMYLLQKYCGNVIARIGKRFGISPTGCLGIVASAVTLVAVFRNYDKMPPLDKVRSVSWALCGGFILADHLVYCYNFQPTLYGCLLVGKVAGGILSLVFIAVFVKKTVIKMEEKDNQTKLLYKIV